MVVDFEIQTPNKDIVLENTTRYKARNLLRIAKGDINHLPYFGFNLEQFTGQTQKVLKLAISNYFMDYQIDMKDIQIDSLKSGIYTITEKITSTPYTGGNYGL